MGGSRRKVALCAAALAAALLVTGCGAPESKRPSGLPAGFPDDVPVHSGTVVQQESVTGKEGGAAYLVSLETPVDVETVAAWYEDRLQANGWKLDGSSYANEKGGTARATKGDTTVNVTFLAGRGQDDKPVTAIAMSVQSF